MMQETKNRYDCVIKMALITALIIIAIQAAPCLFLLPTHLGSIKCSLASEAINSGVLNELANATPKILISIPAITRIYPHLMYTQIAGMTIIAYLVKMIPNVEGFVIMLTQTITVLYMIYYILMFITFLKLRYDQPNRPRNFKVPGGKIGAWIVAGLGLISSVFAIILAIYPPAQVKKEVGSPFIYMSVIVLLVAVVLLICFILYQLSQYHTNWVDPDNEFAPFTWQIEGLDKPEKVSSNIPTGRNV